VGLFRRRQETLNEQLLREAGLDPAQALGDTPQPPVPLEPPKSILSIVGVPDGSSPKPREWDAAVTVDAPTLAGNLVEFTTLPNGDVIIDEESGDADLSPLADAIEGHLNPPYRVVATRQQGHLWGVGAKRIEVARIPFPQGDRLEVSRNGSEGEFRVDSEPSDELVPPELERLGEDSGERYYVEAKRIDGDLWEVRATAL
jgi:hypothetical protein